jgi:hypothetical protein
MPRINDSEELQKYVLSFISNMDLAMLANTSHRFREIQTSIFLSALDFPGGEAVGGRKGKLHISPAANFEAARQALFHAFAIKFETNKPRVQSGSARIMLYRVSEKTLMSGTQKSRFTVSGPFWTVEKTAAWILGGVATNLPFVLVSAVTNQRNFISGDLRRRRGRSEVAIYGREILQLLEYGYWLDFAKESESPTKSSGEIFVLRPPKNLNLYRPVPNRLLWNRDNKGLNDVFIQMPEGGFLTASMLSNFFQAEVDKLRQVVNLAMGEPDAEDVLMQSSSPVEVNIVVTRDDVLRAAAYATAYPHQFPNNNTIDR